ncbi:hypothetical protein ACJX0J_018514, partial [Zea mays]
RAEIALTAGIHVIILFTETRKSLDTTITPLAKNPTMMQGFFKMKIILGQDKDRFYQCYARIHTVSMLPVHLDLTPTASTLALIQSEHNICSVTQLHLDLEREHTMDMLEELRSSHVFFSILGEDALMLPFILYTAQGQEEQKNDSIYHVYYKN